MSEPLSLLWDLLERADCEPHGEPYDFRARCPAHDGKTATSLHVAEGVDRRALVYCFKGCHPEAIVAALGLGLRDLFPPGHRRARKQSAGTRLEGRGPARQVADTLAALDAAGRPWQVLIITSCPYCYGDRTTLTAATGQPLEVDCEFERCSADEFAGALAGELRRRAS